MSLLKKLNYKVWIVTFFLCCSVYQNASAHWWDIFKHLCPFTGPHNCCVSPCCGYWIDASVLSFTGFLQVLQIIVVLIIHQELECPYTSCEVVYLSSGNFTLSPGSNPLHNSYGFLWCLNTKL